MKKPKIVIIMDDGLIQQIYSNVEVDVVKLDYDIEGAEDDELSDVTGVWWNDDRAFVDLDFGTTVDPERVDAILSILER